MIHRFSNDGEPTKTPGQQKLSTRSDMEEKYPLIQLHDNQSVDHSMVGSLAQEIINISGAEVVVYPRTNSESYDEVYEEDPDPTYGAGHKMKAYFSPKPIAAELTQWGVDAPNQTTVVFSREQVYKEFGDRMIRIGDLISLPYHGAGIKPDKYRVLNAADAGNFRYTWLYWSCQVENITNDETIDTDNK